MNHHFYMLLPFLSRRREMEGTEQNVSSGQKGKMRRVATAILPGELRNLVMICCRVTLRKQSMRIPKMSMQMAKGATIPFRGCSTKQIVCNAVPASATRDSSTSTQKKNKSWDLASLFIFFLVAVISSSSAFTSSLGYSGCSLKCSWRVVLLRFNGAILLFCLYWSYLFLFNSALFCLSN